MPDRGDDEHLLADGVPDGSGLERRVRVAARVEEVTQPGQAQIDHARALVTAHRIAFASARSGIVPSFRTTFPIEQLDAETDPGDADAVVVAAAISPATNVPWPCVSTRALEETKLFDA